MRAILMAFGLMAAAPAFAADLLTAPPSPLLNPWEVQGTSKTTFARTFSVGALKGDLGDTLLAKFVTQTRAGKIQKITGNQDQMSWACYDIAGDRVWLSSTDQMASAETIDTITIKPRDPGASACAALPSSQKAAVDGAIRIGMTKADLLARLGPPSQQKADWFVFRAFVPYKSNDGSFITTLVVRLDQGKVAFIEASNTTAD